MRSGRQKLEIRVTRIIGNASMVIAGQGDKVLDAPALTLNQAAVLSREYDFLGATWHSKRTFCDALRRHRARHVRAYKSNADRHVRALRKLIKSYVEMPGVTYREPVAKSA